MNLYVILVLTVLLAMSQQHIATAQVKPQLMALPAEATAAVAAGCACGSEGCPEPPDCQPESPAPPQSPLACVCGSDGCPLEPPGCQPELPSPPQSPSGCVCGTDGCPLEPPGCQLESPALPESPSGCVCGTDGCPELPNCQLESPAPPGSPSACVCGSEGCPLEPPGCQLESPALPESPSACVCGTDGCPELPNCLPAKQSVQLANCTCGTEGCPAPPDCLSDAASAPTGPEPEPEPIQGGCRLPISKAFAFLCLLLREALPCGMHQPWHRINCCIVSVAQCRLERACLACGWRHGYVRNLRRQQRPRLLLAPSVGRCCTTPDQPVGARSGRKRVCLANS